MFQRFGNMAGVFQVMAFGVGALDKKDVDPSFMAKLAKIATLEMISSKVFYSATALAFFYFGLYIDCCISCLSRSCSLKTTS